MASQPRSRRIPELDALRGLAAVAVLLGHWMTVVPAWDDDTRHQPAKWLLNIFKYTPLRLLTAAPEAVLVFFVLSGFVLACRSSRGARAPTAPSSSAGRSGSTRRRGPRRAPRWWRSPSWARRP